MEKKDLYHEKVSPSELTKVRFCTFTDSGINTPNHWHRSIEIRYMLEGRMVCYIDGNTYEMEPGRLLLVNSNVIHADRTKGTSRYILVQIPLDFVRLFIPEIQHIRFIINDVEEQSDKLEQIKKLLLAMKKLNDEKENGYILKFNSMLFEVLYLLYTDFSEKVMDTQLKKQQKNIEKMDRILQYITQNYKHAISLKEISDVVYFRSDYFCRFFKKYMGVTFLEYQNELRLSYIYQDIINTNKPIYEILEQHGFVNYQLFRRMFNRRFGTTPLKVRKNMAK